MRWSREGKKKTQPQLLFLNMAKKLDWELIISPINLSSTLFFTAVQLTFEFRHKFCACSYLLTFHLALQRTLFHTECGHITMFWLTLYSSVALLLSVFILSIFLQLHVEPEYKRCCTHVLSLKTKLGFKISCISLDCWLEILILHIIYFIIISYSKENLPKLL